MGKLQEIRSKMLRDIEDIDGGWATLSRKTGYTTAYLQRVLNKKNRSTPRLETLEKIKQGIKDCLAEDEARVQALLA